MTEFESIKLVDVMKRLFREIRRFETETIEIINEIEKMEKTVIVDDTRS